MNNAHSSGNPVAFLYRWRLKPGMEKQLVEGWARTEMLREHGSLGSRLHRGNEGLWYGYAVWPSVEARERAFAAPMPETGSSMDEAIAERLPEIVLEAVVDLLVPAPLPLGDRTN